jgi:ATP-dependent protease ClpP protease subunit
MLIKKEESLNFTVKNKIFIYGFFDESIPKIVVPDFLKVIEEEEKKSEGIIEFYINSDGGTTYYLKDLLALIEVAKKKNIIIKTYVFGRAYSCGSVLACSGTKGERYIYEYSEHLCHLGSSGTGVTRTDKQLERASERVKAHFDFVRNIYKKYANIKDLEVLLMDDNYFLRGQEIIDNGLADKFLTE